MRYDEFIGQNFYWFTGEIEDIKDPKKKNRVKVRCHGYHVSNKDVITTAQLPWAMVLMPNTSASLKGVGSNHHLEVGSWVVGFFRDGKTAQLPIILGSISSETDGTIDIPEKAQADNYPNNKVYKSEAGHLIEIDNGTLTPAVPGVDAVAAVEASEGVEAVEAVAAVEAVPESRSGETIRVTHVGGSKIEIDENNNLTVYVEEGGDLLIAVEHGDTNIITGGDTKIQSTANTTITSTGTSKIISGGVITISSAEKTRIM